MDPRHPDSVDESTKATRREFLGQIGGAMAAGLALTSGLSIGTSSASAQTATLTRDTTTTGTVPPIPKPNFGLAGFPYAFGALAPAIDERTMEIHYKRHHQAYVDNLNKALTGHAEWIGKPLNYLLTKMKELPDSIRDAVRNNGGGHYNHTLFWEMMTPGGSSEPGGELLAAMNQEFGGVDQFKKAFEDAGSSLFGSGWVFLEISPEGKLRIKTYENQDTPIMFGSQAIFGNDVWEHAYYLNYRNRRREYLENWWTVVNWDRATDRFNGEEQKL